MEAKIHGLKMHYEVAGSPKGIPVVMVHAFPLSGSMWAPQVEALAEKYRVITYDVRGFGGSEPGDGQTPLEFFVDDLLALVDHLELERPVLAGLSMGGYIVLRAAERHAERWRGLVLADTRSEADTNEGKLKRAAQIRTLKSGGLETFADEYLRAALGAGTRAGNPAVTLRVSSMVKAASPTAICGALLAMAGRTDTSEALGAIPCPVLCLGGEKDILTPPEVLGRMAKRFPKGEFHEIPGVGHLSSLEAPQAFNERMSVYMNRLVSV